MRTLRFAAPLAICAAVSLAQAGEESSGEITLRQALAAALVRSPELQAHAAEARAREARALQAGLPPNPTLRAEVEDFGGTGRRRAFTSTQTTVSLAQLVELGGKRSKRRRAADLEADLAGWDYEARRATVLAEVTRAFAMALATQEERRLADELVGVASESVEAVAAQVRAGAVSPLEQERAEVALARSRVERLQLEHELVSARATLASLWGDTRVTFSGVRGDLAEVVAPLSEEAFFRGIERNPDLARWAAELEQRRAVLSLEESRRVPDVLVGVGGRRFNEDEDHAAVLELSLPLPIFDRNQGAIVEATERLAKAQAQRAAAEASVRSALTRAYHQLRAAFDRVTSLRDHVIPRAQAVFTGARDAHARGLFRHLEVLDAQRTLFEVRSQYLRALAAYHGARADVERLSGIPVGDDPAAGSGHP
jgi:cobalt-zinc-cadmium efflux system outer membrane protein